MTYRLYDYDHAVGEIESLAELLVGGINQDLADLACQLELPAALAPTVTLSVAWPPELHDLLDEQDAIDYGDDDL